MNRIRELRKQRGVTQKELAAFLKIADSTLSYWEMGKYEPDNEALKKLSCYFSVPIDYLLGNDAEYPNYSQQKKEASADKTPAEIAIEYFKAENGREPTEDELRTFLSVAKALLNSLPDKKN